MRIDLTIIIIYTALFYIVSFTHISLVYKGTDDVTIGAIVDRDIYKMSTLMWLLYLIIAGVVAVPIATLFLTKLKVIHVALTMLFINLFTLIVLILMVRVHRPLITFSETIQLMYQGMPSVKFPDIRSKFMDKFIIVIGLIGLVIQIYYGYIFYKSGMTDVASVFKLMIANIIIVGIYSQTAVVIIKKKLNTLNTYTG